MTREANHDLHRLREAARRLIVRASTPLERALIYSLVAAGCRCATCHGTTRHPAHDVAALAADELEEMADGVPSDGRLGGVPGWLDAWATP